MASKVIAVRLPQNLYEQLERERERERRTRSNMLAVLVEEALTRRAERLAQAKEA